MRTLLQIGSAFFATLGGLMISFDFIGSEKLDRIERSFREHFRSSDIRLGDFFLGGWMMILMLLGNLVKVVGFLALLTVLYLLNTYWSPMPFVTLGITYFVVCAITVIIQRNLRKSYHPNWDRVALIVLFPLLGLWFTLCLVIYIVSYILGIIFLAPVFNIYYLREKYHIPYLVKLLGACIVVCAFVLYICSYVFP